MSTWKRYLSKKGKKSKPRYADRVELPLHEVKYAEADCRLYGSGRMILDMLTIEVRLLLPWMPAAGIHGWKDPDGRWREALMALRKIDPTEGASPSAGVSLADAAEWPLIIEYLTATKYPDGKPRVTGSLVIVSDGTSWRVCLSDKDNGRVMWKTGQTLQEGLQAVEMALMADDPTDWRRSAEASGKRRK